MEQIQKPADEIRIGIIPADDSAEIQYKTVKRDYKFYREIVGGYLEIVRPRGFVRLNEETGRRHILVVDEEGAIKGDPINPRASLIYGMAIHGQPIVGNVIIATEALLWSREDMMYEPDIYGLADDFELQLDSIG